jgi:hypothetical protein
MPQLPLMPVGPISSAVAPLITLETTSAFDASLFLSQLVDLRGGVALADTLIQLEAQQPLEASPDPVSLRLRLRDEVVALESRLVDALENAFKPRYRLPTPARAWTLFDQAGLFAQAAARGATAARQRAAAGATRTLWAPFDDFFETHLKRARFGLRDLRAELGPGLRALGEDAARLERLDAALRLACGPETEALLRRARARLEEVMGDRLRAALKGLGPQPKIADIEALWGQGAAVAATFEDGRRCVQAVFAHERHRLEALVHACLGLHRP